MPICGSPWLIAADRVLLRRLVPWHPPCALISLITKTNVFSLIRQRLSASASFFSRLIFRSALSLSSSSMRFSRCGFHRAFRPPGEDSSRLPLQDLCGLSFRGCLCGTLKTIQEKEKEVTKSSSITNLLPRSSRFRLRRQCAPAFLSASRRLPQDRST